MDRIEARVWPFARTHPGPRLDVLRAESLPERLRGVLGRESLLEACALWISPCCAIHTFGLATPIDAVFVGFDGAVLRVDSGLGPRRLRYCRGARGVLELAAGSARKLDLDAPGVRIEGLVE